MPEPKLCAAATLFVVQDVTKSVAHYSEVLRFKVGFVYGDPIFYGGVERDEVTIHLQAAHATERHVGQGAINIFVTEVDALYEELKACGARLLNLPQDRAYGMRDFDLDDLDGNRLTFGMSLNGKS
jgi:uncharacterized glyoxalase superfamily protein PhnB